MSSPFTRESRLLADIRQIHRMVLLCRPLLQYLRSRAKNDDPHEPPRFHYLHLLPVYATAITSPRIRVPRQRWTQQRTERVDERKIRELFGSYAIDALRIRFLHWQHIYIPLWRLPKIT